jgi:hypothetical protein
MTGQEKFKGIINFNGSKISLKDVKPNTFALYNNNLDWIYFFTANHLVTLSRDMVREDRLVDCDQNCPMLCLTPEQAMQVYRHVMVVG